MPSPIKPSDIEAAVVSPLSKVCTRFDQLLKLPQILSTFWSWAFDSLGNATEAFKDLFITIGVPIGGIIEWPAPVLPVGFLLCDGQQVSRVTYAKLYSVIGTIYGVGDGTNTFNVPDYRSIFLVGEGGAFTAGPTLYGETAHTLTAAEGAIQGHKHGVGKNDPSNDDAFIPRAADVTVESVNAMFLPGSGNTLIQAPITTVNMFTTPPVSVADTPTPFPLVPSCRAVKRLIKF